jgi:hypothetical protein
LETLYVENPYLHLSIVSANRAAGEWQIWVIKWSSYFRVTPESGNRSASFPFRLVPVGNIGACGQTDQHLTLSEVSDPLAAGRKLVFFCNKMAAAYGSLIVVAALVRSLWQFHL